MAEPSEARGTTASDPRSRASWEDLVTVALLGTDRRPVPEDLPPTWAVPVGSDGDPTHAVLAHAVRHRTAVRAGSGLPTGPPGPVAPADPDPSPGPPELQQQVADAIARGGTGPINDALMVLVDLEATLASDHWTAAATVAARNPRVDRALLACALGVRGVWFVAQNPQWARLATALRAAPKGPA